MVYLKNDFEEYARMNNLSKDNLDNVRLSLIKKHVRDFLYLYSISNPYTIIDKKRELEKEINEINNKINTNTNNRFNYDEVYRMTLFELKLKLEIISKFDENNIDDKRTINNFENIRLLLSYLHYYFNGEDYFISFNNENKNSLKLHNLLLVEQFLFEKIYKEVEKILSISSNISDFETIIQNKMNVLLSRYKSDLISSVMNKYFTDNSLDKIPVTESPRKNFKIMRGLIPQSNNDKLFTSHRNMSSHGDFDIDDDFIEKKGNRENVDDLNSRIDNIINSIIDSSEKDYYKRLVNFSNENSTIEDFIVVSATALIEYNYEQYLVRDENLTNLQNFLEAFIVKNIDTYDVHSCDINEIFGIIKHSMGHGNVSFEKNTIRFVNTKGRKSVEIDFYDYVEILLSSFNSTIYSFSNEFRRYNDALKKVGLPEDVLPFRHDVAADGNIAFLINRYGKSPTVKNYRV